MNHMNQSSRQSFLKLGWKSNAMKRFRITLILIVFISALFPVIVFSSLLMYKIKTVTYQSVIRELNITALHVSEMLNHELDLIISRLTDLGTNPDIAIATRKNVLGLQYFLSDRATNYINKFIEDFPLVESIYLTDLKLHIHLKSPQTSNSPLPPLMFNDILSLMSMDRENIKKLFKVIEFKDDRFNQTSSYPKKSKSKSMFYSDYGIALLAPIILDVTNEIKGFFVAIIPMSNMMLYGLDKLNPLATLDFLKENRSILTNNKSIQTNQNEINYIDSYTLFQISKVETIQYTIKISEPEHIRFSGVKRTLKELTLVNICAILSLTLFAYIITRWLTSPLRILMQIVKTYSNGIDDSDITVPIKKKLIFTEFIQFVELLTEMKNKIVLQIEGIKKTEEKYRTIYENAVEGIFQSTPDGKLISVNPSMMNIFGYVSPEEFLGSIDDVANQLYVRPEDRSYFNHILNKHHKIKGFETQMYHKNGDKIWVSISARTVCNKDNEVMYYEGTIEHISQRKLAEEKLIKLNEELEKRVKERTVQYEEANQALFDLLDKYKRTQSQLVQSEKMASLGNLVAGVAHEINTPIGITVTDASFLEDQTHEFKKRYQEGTLTRSDFEKYIDNAIGSSTSILSNLNRASELITSFKQVAVDQSYEEKRTFLVKEYIYEVLISLRSKLKKTQHQVIVNCPDKLSLYSYPGAFSQIITNLIMNSLIHGFEHSEQGEISINILLENNELIFHYHDNGCGMDQETVQKIFDPFFTTKRGQGGTGLGLHVVYNIVTQTLGGQIMCLSQKGQGADFYIIMNQESLKITTDL
ncbi:MAG: PAS domain S-box protein [Desulfobacterales bacterium]|nr:PAS domain S-box protein [Desulfobacterales bacterium]